MNKYIILIITIAFLNNATVTYNKEINKLPGKSSITRNCTSNLQYVSQTADRKYKSSLPRSIMFERKVIQTYYYNPNSPVTVTYYFTVNGDYILATAANVPEYKDQKLLFTKEGGAALIDDNTKTISIMNMPASAGEGALMAEKFSEKFTGKNLSKDKSDGTTITKTDRTKTICNYTSYEYAINESGETGYVWFAAVDFDPLRMYTMGVGRDAFTGSLQNIAAELKNNPVAIAVLNKNYLEAEIDDQAGNKIQETKSIDKTAFILSTAEYTVKDMSKMDLMEMIKEGNKKDHN